MAFESVGGECVFSSEIGIEERLTYFMNFGSFPSGDITETPTSTVPGDHKYELLTAGFPCQSFCKAGLKTGLNDARGELFFEVLRFANAARPAAMLLENVPHLMKVDEGAALATILDELSQIGYKVHHRLLSSRNVVPQDRLRLYIACFLDEKHHAAFKWPERLIAKLEEASPTPPCVREILEDASTVDPDFTVNEHQWQKLQAREDVRLVDRDRGSRTIIASYKNAHSTFCEFVADEEETKQVAAGTLAQLSGPPRFFTPREVARLQGFPASTQAMLP